MQSPAGWLCILLVTASMVIVPILEHYFDKEKNARLVACGIITEKELKQMTNKKRKRTSKQENADE